MNDLWTFKTWFENKKIKVFISIRSSTLLKQRMKSIFGYQISLAINRVRLYVSLFKKMSWEGRNRNGIYIKHIVFLRYPHSIKYFKELGF